jgi:transcription elongation GreA/GreB family factor
LHFTYKDNSHKNVIRLFLTCDQAAGISADQILVFVRAFSDTFEAGHLNCLITMQTLKENIHHTYQEMTLQKIKALQKEQEDIMESLRQETKSTAGDKYETSRAMLHMEQGNIASQLAVLLQQKAILESITTKSNFPTETVQLGSLVKTNKGYIFIAAALGKATIDAQTIFAVSPESPLGKLLIGKPVQEQITIQKAIYVIEAIF